MANLQETSTWEAGIYQLETSDPVMGGENGIDNRAPRQLANRTLWLKNELARQIGAVNSGKLGKTENAISATKLATARNIAMTGDGVWNVNFDGSGNATGVMTLANTGVRAGSYNSVTVDAKGRVTAGLTQTHGLVTATTATGTANTATTNTNTFLNIVASGVGTASSVGSSTQITGTNGITVSSDTAGKLILGQTLANSLTDTSTAKALTALQGKVLDEKIAALGNEKVALRGQLGTTDLNTLTAANHTGVWYQDGNRNALAEYNYPAQRAGILFVLPSVWQGQQLYFPYNETVIYSRHVNGSNWSAWLKIGDIVNDLGSTSVTASLSANQGKILNDTKLGNTGHQTLNGQLGITRNAWEKMRFTNSDGSYWRFESAVVTSSENGARFNWVFTGSDGTEVGRISFPRVSTGETIAYQSWVQTANVATAAKLATARNIAMTGDGAWNVNFDGSGNATGVMTLSNSGVTAGSYNSVTVDAKGRVTAGLTQTHGLVTATTAQGTANVATGNSNTFLNIVASGVGQTASVGSSTQITGTNGITVSSDTAGKLILGQTLANSLTDTATNKSLTANMGKVLKDELDTTVKLTGEQTITGKKIFGEITVSPASIDNSLILGVGASDVYIKNTTANKYLQFKNDGTLAISNDKVWLYSDRSDAVNLDRTDKIATAKAVNTLNNTKLGKSENAVSATRLQTARNIALTGAVIGNVNFDGSGNVSIGTALNLTEFANLKAENGYQRLPNGLIFQWGKLASDRYLGESAQSITFPISFPTACLNVQANMYMTRHSSLGDGGVFVVDFDRSTANFSLQNIGTTSVGDLRGFYWFAIGY